MKVIIAGSREGFEYADVVIALEEAGFEVTEVVSGTARGVDRFGEMFALKHNIPITRFPADWDTHGKRAGYLRNAQMAEYAEALVALWDGQSKGTKHMIDLAEKNNLEVFVYER